jgi:hypothetical protein
MKDAFKFEALQSMLYILVMKLMWRFSVAMCVHMCVWGAVGLFWKRQSVGKGRDCALRTTSVNMR